MPSVRSSCVLLCIGVLANVSVAQDAFLDASGSKAGVPGNLLAELERALGPARRALIEARVPGLEELLRPLHASMPQSAGGRLSPAGVRYALHRVFVEKHGWLVSGLEPAGEGWGSASPTNVLDARVPDQVQSFFEGHLASHGYGLHELSVLAATLEDLIHSEATVRMRAAYNATALPVSRRLDVTEVEQVIDAYMTMYILGQNHSTITREEYKVMEGQMLDVYPSWPETQAFVRKVRQGRAGGAATAAYAFDDAVGVVEEIGDKFGKFQDVECKDLKRSLSKLEHGESGRVPLRDFYGAALAGQWQFGESGAYLRQLGALDESVPEQPAVIIANYVNSPSNCISSSSFYAVCCLDECEPLLGHLERSIAAPDATPSQLAELVAALPSATVAAPRALEPALLARLEGIARTHGGRVPLHGRLFAQWLHHAYPRECPYPHSAGTTRPVTAEVWEADTGTTSTASEEEMRQHTDNEGSRRSLISEELPWTHEEELFVSRPALAAREVTRVSPWAVGRGMILVILLGSLALSLGRTVETAQASVGAGRVPKKLVV